MSTKAPTEHEQRNTVHAPASGDLILCLRGGGYDEKVLHVRSSQCTLGGREDCTVPLPEGAPLQCVILRGRDGTVVRDWTGETRLNGQSFTDSPLNVGDCLQVGPVTVHVLADCAATNPVPCSLATSHREPVADHAVRDDAAPHAAVDDGAEGIHRRFDRLEGRMTRLERMVAELLKLQREASPHPAAPNEPSHALPLSAADSETERLAAQQEATLPAESAPRAGLPDTPDLRAPLPASPVPIELEPGPLAEKAEEPQVPLWVERKDDEELDPSVREYIERLLKQISLSAEESTLAAEESVFAHGDAVPNDAQTPGSAAESTSAAGLPASETPLPTAAEDRVEPPNRHRPGWAAVAAFSEADPAETNSQAAAPELVEDPPAILPTPPVLAPLSLPPEQQSNLDAMREVANLSATAAIRTYEKHQALRKTFDRLPLLLIGLICGLMLLYSALASGRSGILVGAGAALLAATLTAWQVLVIARRWLWPRQPSTKECKTAAGG